MLKRNQESIKALYSIVSSKLYGKESFFVPILEDFKGNTIL